MRSLKEMLPGLLARLKKQTPAPNVLPALYPVKAKYDPVAPKPVATHRPKPPRNHDYASNM